MQRVCMHTVVIDPCLEIRLGEIQHQLLKLMWILLNTEHVAKSPGKWNRITTDAGSGVCDGAITARTVALYKPYYLVIDVCVTPAIPSHPGGVFPRPDCSDKRGLLFYCYP